MWCPSCNTGDVIPLRTASGDVVFRCDEQDCMWLRPQDVTRMDPFFEDVDFASAGEGAQRVVPYATAEDIAKMPWADEWDEREFPLGPPDSYEERRSEAD